MSSTSPPSPSDPPSPPDSPATPSGTPDPAPGTTTSRRTLLRRGAVVGAVGTTGLGLGTASAEARKPGRYQGAPLLSSADRHLVSRFSYGVTPELTRQVHHAGGAREWFERQLSPGRISDRHGDRLAAWWPSMRRGPQDLWQRNTNGVEGGWEVMQSYQRWLLMRRVESKRQLAEVMTEFWMNHLNVPVHADAVFTYRCGYDGAVRSHALGSFQQLLQSAITHPAMGLYLDNAVSTKAAPNENLGRELLELHTVGRGSYDEDDVKNSARILTGYLVDKWSTWDATYSTRDHWTGPVQVMGFRHANTDPDGRAVAKAYLRYLAHHPRTARRIAYKLCVAFVSDTPSDRLVSKLADVYLRHGTHIKPVLRALVDSAEFKRSAGRKVRDPSADVVATYRALRVKVSKPPATDNAWAATAILWQAESVGQSPVSWPRPDGQPIDNAAWSSPARLLASMEVHWGMSGGWWPGDGIRYISPVAWLPQKRVRYDVLVDHLSQQLLGRRSTGVLLTTCLQACPPDWSVRPSTIIDAQHPVVRWGFVRLLAAILDTPTHYTR